MRIRVFLPFCLAVVLPFCLTGCGGSETPSGPIATLSSNSLNFQTIELNNVSSQRLVISNTGTAPLIVTSINTTPATFNAQTNDCTAQPVAPPGSCSISVTFTPVVSGNETGTLSITDNASGSPQTVSLYGTGATQAPGVTLSPSPLSFGEVSATGGATGGLQVSLINIGTAPLTITSISTSPASLTSSSQVGYFTLQSNTNCPSTLAAGTSCPIYINFTPNPQVSGGMYGTLSVADNASGSPQTIQLQVVTD